MSVPTVRSASYVREPASVPAPARSMAAAEQKQWWGLMSAILITLIWIASFAGGFRLSLTILTVLGYGAVVLGAYYPALGLLGITVLCLLDAPSRVFLLNTGGLLRWNTLNYWLLLMMALYLPFLVRLRDRHNLTLMALSGLMVVDLVISTNITDGIQNVLGIVTVLGLVIYFVRAGSDRQMWLWIGIDAGLMGALGGLAFFLHEAQMPTINPNAWAAFPVAAIFAICLAFPSVVALKRGQATLMVLASINVVWVFLSASRGSLLVASCCMIVLFLTMRGLRQRTVAIAVGLFICLAALGNFSQLQDKSLHRIVKLVTTDEPLAGNYSLTSRTSGRSDLAIGGWYIFEEHPLGVGTGGFRIAWRDLDRRADMGSYGRGEERAAHSGWVMVLAENGAPGILLLLAYVLSFAIVGWRKRDRVLRRLGLLTTLAVGVGLLSTEFQSKSLWFLAAGVTVFLQRDELNAAMYTRVVTRGLGRRRPLPGDP